MNAKKLLLLLFTTSLVLGISLICKDPQPVQAKKCPQWNPLCKTKLPPIPPISPIKIEDLDPTSPAFAEKQWGNAGAGAFQAAAAIMRNRHGSGQGLDDIQKQYLRPVYGGLVDGVSVVYGASMMNDWKALGFKIDLGGVDSAAQTYCNRIYVRDAYQNGNRDQLLLLAHELRHSQQCQELGGSGKFGYHYFREYKRAGQNYENNAMEKSAVEFANKIANTPISVPPSPSALVGYFADGGTTFYAEDRKFCGFLSAAHYQMHGFGKDNVPRLGNRSKGEFGSDGGACSIPSGYFAYENATHYSLGNGQYCSFFTADTYDRHSSQRPQDPRFGVLTSDPKGFMTWAGGCP
jgi:hypothetical protein